MWKDTGFCTVCGIFFSVFPLSEPCVGVIPCFFPVTSGCQGFPGGHGPVQPPASFLLLRGPTAFRAAPAPYSVQQASCYFGVRTPSGRSRPRTASRKLPVTSGPHGLPGRPGPEPRPASPGVCLIADTKSLLLFWLFSVHDSNCQIS